MRPAYHVPASEKRGTQKGAHGSIAPSICVNRRFHLDGDPLRTDRQDEIDFRFVASHGEVSHIQAGNGRQKIPQCTFGQPSGNVRQMRIRREAIHIERHNFLQPGCSQCMIREAELGEGLLSFQAKLDGLHEAHQQRRKTSRVEMSSSCSNQPLQVVVISPFPGAHYSQQLMKPSVVMPQA